MEIRTIVADDEKPARDEITYLLRAVEGIKLVGEADNGLDAYNLIEAEQPDLALLDIQMPGLDGFQLVREIRHLERSPFVIFVTAYDRYAIQAFEVSALDYLLKPVVRDRLVQAIDRVRPLLERQAGQSERRDGDHGDDDEHADQAARDQTGALPHPEQLAREHPQSEREHHREDGRRRERREDGTDWHHRLR